MVFLSLTCSTDSSQKVPTILLYNEDATDGLQWGYQIDPTADPGAMAIKGLKLLLDDSKPLKYTPSKESKDILKSLGKSPLDATADYLTVLVAYLKKILRRRYHSTLRVVEIQYTLTVPAFWSDKAKDLAMQAAVQAGIHRNNLVLLSEPEAAAVYAIRAVQPNKMAVRTPRITCACLFCFVLLL